MSRRCRGMMGIRKCDSPNPPEKRRNPEPFMPKRKHHRVVLLATALGVAAATALAVFLKEPMREQWYIWALGSDDSASCPDAAKRLGRMRSTRAVPRLIEILRNADGEERLIAHPAARSSRRLHYSGAAWAGG